MQPHLCVWRYLLKNLKDIDENKAAGQDMYLANLKKNLTALANLK